MSAGDNWFRRMVAVGGQIDQKCRCGRALRHRGSCEFRQSYQTADPSTNRRVSRTEAGPRKRATY
jgi:hypothetical protein